MKGRSVKPLQQGVTPKMAAPVLLLLPSLPELDHSPSRAGESVPSP